MFFLALFATLTTTSAQRLTIKNEQFYLNNNRVFLSGTNQPWYSYSNDFGNNRGQTTLPHLVSTMNAVKDAGGNSIRIWLHIDAQNTPTFKSDGSVKPLGPGDTLISDMENYLKEADKLDILVFFCLWNGAQPIPDKIKGLITTQWKLKTYTNNVLKPMVNRLKNYRSLGGWEIMNEPEGSVAAGVPNANRCHSTKNLQGTGAGWTKSAIAMKDLQTFVAIQTEAIHEADPGALVTVGTWSEKSGSDRFGYTNYWSAKCLDPSGQRKKASLDFAQFHSYTHDPVNNDACKRKFSLYAPFKKSKSDFGLNMPLVIGEFSKKMDKCQYALYWSTKSLYQYVYDHGYDGAWGWSASGHDDFDGLPEEKAGLAQIRGKPGTDLPCARSPTCTDRAPGSHSCQQQSSWGKCSQSWMRSYCCRSCGHCNAAAGSQGADTIASPQSSGKQIGNEGLIIGISVGVGVLLLVVLCVSMLLKRKTKREINDTQQEKLLSSKSDYVPPQTVQ